MTLLAVPAMFCLSALAAQAIWVSNTITDETEGIIIGGTDTVEGIAVDGPDTVAPELLPGAGTHPVMPKIEAVPRIDKVDGRANGWDVLPGMSESIFFPGGWGVEGETQGELTADTLGIFSPGGWGLEGMDVETFSGEAPGGFSLWWRGVTESVSLAFTFDPVKKAEKRLEFAEERMGIAASLAANADDPKVQKRIEKSVEKAQKFLGDIEKDQGKWFDAESQGSQQLLGNVVRHQFNREAVMDTLEANLSEGQLGNIRQVRQEGLEGNGRLLNAISNENVPPAVKIHLEGLKMQIDEHADEVRTFRMQKQDLLRRDAGGESGAGVRLEQLQGNRRDRVDLRIRIQPQIQRMSIPPVDREAASGLPTGKRQFEGGVQLMEWKVEADGLFSPPPPPPEDAVPGLPADERQINSNGLSPQVIDPTIQPQTSTVSPNALRSILKPLQESSDIVDPVSGDGQAEPLPTEE